MDSSPFSPGLQPVPHSDLSTGSATPETSPLFSAALSDRTVESRFSNLSDLISSDDVVPIEQARRPKLPDVLDPASASGISVRNVVFVGAGYVGVPTAAVIALKNPGLSVTVIDRDARRIRRWNSSHLPINEPGLNKVVRIVRDGHEAAVPAADAPAMESEAVATAPVKAARQARKPNLSFTTNTAASIAAADMIFVCVNTGTKKSGVGAGSATDMTAFESVVREIAEHGKTGAILVEKSTVPCRTAKLVSDILEALRPDAHMEVLSNPEFLSEGTAVPNLLHPDRIIIGSAHTAPGHRAAAALAKLYTTFVPPSRIVTTHAWSSELAKLVANAMLAQRISSINSISAICERTGADVHEVARAVGMDARIGSKFLGAGLGYGGSCFRKDIGSLVYLARSLNLPEVGEYWEGVSKINMLQRERFSKNVVRRLNGTLIGKKITLFGFAFKKNTDDTRESLAVDVIRSLLAERPAEIAVFDPVCHPDAIQREIDHELGVEVENTSAVKIHTDPYQAAVSASAILIITDWDFFKSSPAPKSRSPVLKPTAAVSQAKPQDQDLSISPEELPAQPPCPDDCPDCRISYQGYASSDDRIEWARISYHMKRPKLAFDGRGVLDQGEMEPFGVNVIGIGKGTEEYGVSGVF